MYYSKFTKQLSTLNYYTQSYDPYAYKSYKSHYRCMKIPKGLLINYLKDCNLYATIKREADFPYKNIKEFKMINEPLNDLQKTVISDVVDTFKSGENRAIISLKTGKGKTYVATNIISKIKVRTLIMVKSIELKKQWVESFMRHTNCKSIYTIDKGTDLVDLLQNENENPDIIICTHRSMSIFMNEFGAKDFGLLLLKLGIGMKVYDEFDLENASMFNMDMNSSIKYNLYLSATDYKSSRSENFIFKKIFLNVFNTGKEFESNTKRNALFILYNSNPSKAERGKCMQYSPEGMVFSYSRYHEYITNKFAFSKILKRLWDKFISTRHHDKLKTVFFIGRKTTAEAFKGKLQKLIGLKDSDISILNSDTPKNDRQKAMESTLIISTSNSLGRGIDLKGLDTVIDFETRSSKSATNQVIGRVSRTGMKNVGTYIQFVDTAFPVVKRNYDRKVKDGFFDELFTDIKINNEN